MKPGVGKRTRVESGLEDGTEGPRSAIGLGIVQTSPQCGIRTHDRSVQAKICQLSLSGRRRVRCWKIIGVNVPSACAGEWSCRHCQDRGRVASVFTRCRQRPGFLIRIPCARSQMAPTGFRGHAPHACSAGPSLRGHPRLLHARISKLFPRYNSSYRRGAQARRMRTGVEGIAATG